MGYKSIMKTDQRAGEGNKSIMRTHLRVREYTEDRYTSVYLICKIVLGGYLQIYSHNLSLTGTLTDQFYALFFSLKTLLTLWEDTYKKNVFF